MKIDQWMSVLSAMLLVGVLFLLIPGSATALQVGDKAPDFSLPATTAEKVGLADYLGKKPIVLFFYIAAFSPT